MPRCYGLAKYIAAIVLGDKNEGGELVQSFCHEKCRVDRFPVLPASKNIKTISIVAKAVAARAFKTKDGYNASFGIIEELRTHSDCVKKSPFIYADNRYYSIFMHELRKQLDSLR